jgi:TetR/AcrR family transcriptional regulator, mexJK operon transcriptional repressor
MRAGARTGEPPSDTRTAILRAARKAFLRHGYEASLDVIADAAGVARRTVFYNFGSKERLFREIIEEMTAEADTQLVIDRARPLAEALLDYARTYVRLVLSPETLAIQRMLLSGAPNLLAHMRAVVERNYVHLIAELAKYFRERIADGEMRAVNPERAAERFLVSILGLDRVHMMLGHMPDDGDRDAYVREAVDGFMDGVHARARMNRTAKD